MVSKVGIEPTVNTGSLNQRVCQLRHLDMKAVNVLLNVVLPKRFELSMKCGLSAPCLPIPPEELMAGVAGLEPATHGLTARCSTY